MILETTKMKKGNLELFANNGEIADKTIAFRVKDSANEILILIDSPDNDVYLHILKSNHVFGGTDAKFLIFEGETALMLDASIYVQTDGEYKGCILLHTETSPCKVDVKEIC